jgi:hypothetical protein
VQEEASEFGPWATGILETLQRSIPNSFRGGDEEVDYDYDQDGGEES